MRREEEGATDGEGRPVSGGGRRRIRGRQGKEGSGQCVAILGRCHACNGGLEGSHLHRSPSRMAVANTKCRSSATDLPVLLACPGCTAKRREGATHASEAAWILQVEVGSVSTRCRPAYSPFSVQRSTPSVWTHCGDVMILTVLDRPSSFLVNPAI